MLLLATVLACGGRSTASQPHGDEHHAQLSPELARFHDVLAPRWHAEAGPARMKSTCDAIGDFRARADAIGKAVPPESTHADTWTSKTRKLADAVEGLAATCAASDATGFDPAFARVHESFEALADSAQHDQHAEHDEHEGER